jgi:hypothetical protein
VAGGEGSAGRVQRQPLLQEQLSLPLLLLAATGAGGLGQLL